MGGSRKIPIISLVVFMLVFSTVSTSIDKGTLLTGGPPTVNVLGRGMFQTVNDAIDAARDGDVILVGAGVYKDDVCIDKSVTLIGDGPQTVYTSTLFVKTNNVVVQGHTFQNIYNSNWNNAAGITTLQDYPGSTPLTGITIRSCTFNNVQHGVYFIGATYSLVDSCTFTNSWRGVSIQTGKTGSGNPWRSTHHNTVKDCTFTNMRENNGCEGEAIAINDTDSNTIQDNVIDNCPWGVMIYRGDNNVVEGNTITNSSKDPIYVCSVSTSTTVKDNDIYDNKGNVDFRHSRGQVFSNNRLHNNSAPITLLNSNSMTFSGNVINGSTILLDRSTGVTFTNNEIIVDKKLSMDFLVTAQAHYNHNIATSNTVNGNPIYYTYGAASPTYENITGAGSMMYAFCTNANITNVSVEDGDGIRLFYTSYANITANVTNCLNGIEGYYSTDGQLVGCNVDTSSRGKWGIKLYESPDLETHDSVITTTTAPAWRLEGADVYRCYNTTFPYNSVSANENGGGELWAYADLTVKVRMNETLVPLAGVEAEFMQEETVMYGTPHFGGSDNTSDDNGTIGPVTLLDRIYKNFNRPIENDHTVELWLDIDDVWTVKVNNLNMSLDKVLVFETSDVWRPGMPGNFGVTDIPEEDALEVSWNLNADDTVTYSLWTNMSGSWDLLENLTSDVSSYRIDQGLVHGGDYWFALSAWDEVPLESERTAAAMVTHVDGVAPDIPTGLQATDVKGTNFTISWNANSDTDLEGYRVYINDTGGDENGPWVLITASTGFTDTTLWVEGLTSETDYYVVVTAIDERPNESPFSEALKVTTADITPPDAPLIDPLPEWTNVKTRSITGSGEAGATLRLLLNGQVIDAVEVGPLGDWSVQVELEEGTNTFTARLIDPSGNMGDLSGEVSTTLDTIAPLAPELDALPSLTNVVEHTMEGTAEPHSTVTVLLNGDVLDTIVLGEEGTFMVSLTLVEGENTITAFATDRALNEGPSTEVVTVVLDTIAPDVPDVDPLPEYTNIATHTVAGTAEGGSLVELMVDGEVVDSVTADGGGAYEFALVLDGRQTLIMLRATDDAGNVGDNTDVITIILDTEEPVAAAGEDQEAVEDTEVSFDGSGSTDNEGIATYEWSFELDGSPVTLEEVMTSYTFPDVVVLTVTLTVTDLAGNAGTDTMELTIISSNLPPTLRRGEMDPEKGHTDTKFTFSVEFKDPDGDNGEVWIYIDGESFLMTPDPEDTDPSDGQTYIYETKLTKGEHTYYFTGRDAFGNDAEGPAAGEDNARTSPDIEKKKVSDSPAPGLVAAIGALAIMVLVIRRRRR